MNNRALKYIVSVAMSVAIGGVMLANGATAPIYDLRFKIADLRDTLTTDTTETAAPSFVPLVTNTQDSVALTPPSEPRDTAANSAPFLDSPIEGTSRDSLIFDAKTRQVYIYGEGDVTYQTMEMKADYMKVSMESRELFARGVVDSLGNRTKPQFTDGDTYEMDSINYNTRSGKAKLYGVATQQGEGFLIGDHVKRMADNSIHMEGGKYTTCDDVSHPHFYLRLTKGKVIPGEKVVVGYSYLVMADVPIYFPGIPEAFFPINMERTSGILVPTWGEEYSKGFYLRDGGYYFVLGEHADLALRAGIYTLGSWEANAVSNYTKRYKYRGSIDARYSRDFIPDQINQNSYSIRWTHSQDPKANPGQSFQASVNFSTSGYNRYASQSIDEYLNTQTSSNINYSRTWAGTPFSLSASMTQSQNSSQKTMQFGLPTISLNMSKIFPFKNSDRVGKERWYEKISLSYTGNLQNSTNFREDLYQTDKFGKVIVDNNGDSLKYNIWDQMVDNMRNGIKHSVPISLPLNLFGYINITMSSTYTERWYFQRTMKEWDSDLRKVVDSDPEYGFFRVYDFGVSASAETKIYGDIQFRSPNSFVQAIRHTITPSIGLGYTPDFGNPWFDFYRTVQSDSLGGTSVYSPYQNGVYGTAGRGESGTLRFSLVQTLEAKFLSKTDTSGIKKYSLIDNLSFSGNYNFLADSLNLSIIQFGLRIKLPFLGPSAALNLTGSLDPYRVDKRTGQRINQFYGWKGGLARLVSTGWSFGHTFKGGDGTGVAPGEMVNAMGMSGGIDPYIFDDDNPIDPTSRRQLMANTYYDFKVPWSLTFNYNVSYSNNGVRQNITQGLTFNGNLNLTKRFGITMSGGFDFNTMQLIPGNVTLTADLHCWQMSFNWVPIGSRRQWSFSIHVKSAMLRDLKYEQSSSYLDTIFDQ